MKLQSGLLFVSVAVLISVSGFPASAKTAKECTAEWRADKAGMQARGTTEKAYVEQCKSGSEPTSAAPVANSAAPAPKQATATGSKSAKDCIAEWRADKAGMQARGTTEKAYVEQCKAGEVMPSATVSEPKPIVAAPVQPSAPASNATQAAPVVPAKQRSAPTATVATTAAPQPATPRGNGTLDTGQFADEGSAKARCPADTVVWVNLRSKIYHFSGTKDYGTTNRGAYMCEKEAITAEDRASKTETHP